MSWYLWLYKVFSKPHWLQSNLVSDLFNPVTDCFLANLNYFHMIVAGFLGILSFSKN